MEERIKDLELKCKGAFDLIRILQRRIEKLEKSQRPKIGYHFEAREIE